VVSWPGIYAHAWDALVAEAKANSVSAAVVFLPEETPDFGAHGDVCYCAHMYGSVKPWGCKWFQIWCAHVEQAVSLNQRLQVYFCEGMVSRGKVLSWEVQGEDASRRFSLQESKRDWLRSLPDGEQQRLEALSEAPRDDLVYVPGSEREDEEERIFLLSLSEADREFLGSHKGLGNSQKAEVAWLEKRYKETGNKGYIYEELDVRAFRSSGGTKAISKNPSKFFSMKRIA
jgi:hypothetical protein